MHPEPEPVLPFFPQTLKNVTVFGPVEGKNEKGLIWKAEIQGKAPFRDLPAETSLNLGQAGRAGGLAGQLPPPSSEQNHK